MVKGPGAAYGDHLVKKTQPQQSQKNPMEAQFSRLFAEMNQRQELEENRRRISDERSATLKRQTMQRGQGLLKSGMYLNPQNLNTTTGV